MKKNNRGGRGMAFDQSRVRLLADDKVRTLSRYEIGTGVRDRNLSSRPIEENMYVISMNSSSRRCAPHDDGGIVRKLHLAVNLKLIVLTIFCVLFSHPVAAQESRHHNETTGPLDVKPLMIGEQMPKAFWEREFLFYEDGDTVRRKLDLYKGKLIVLDFWATWCAICIASMKETEGLFAKYPNTTKLLFVNPTQTKDDYKRIVNMQGQLSENSLKGHFTSIIEDDYLHQLFPNRIYPRYVWIGPWGDLIAMTTSLSVSEQHVAEILNRLKMNHDAK